MGMGMTTVIINGSDNNIEGDKEVSIGNIGSNTSATNANDSGSSVDGLMVKIRFK